MADRMTPLEIAREMVGMADYHREVDKSEDSDADRVARELVRLSEPMTDSKLKEIEQRYRDADTPGQCLASMQDVPGLLVEVARLRAELAQRLESTG